MCATAQGYYTPQNHRPGALQAHAELCPPPTWLFEAWQSSRDPAPFPAGPRPWQPPGVQGTEVFDVCFQPLSVPPSLAGQQTQGSGGAAAVVFGLGL